MLTQQSTIFDTIYTKSDARDLIDLLNSTKSQLFIKHEGAEFQEALAKLPVDIVRSIKEYAAAKKLNLANIHDFEAVVTALEQELNDIPIITLQVAVSPSLNTITTISKWFSENIGYRVLVDIMVKKEIIAGAALEFRGYYKDYSLKDKFHSYFGKTRLTSLLSRA